MTGPLEIPRCPLLSRSPLRWYTVDMTPKSMKRQPGRPCSACVHPRLAEIDEAILEKQPDMKIGRDFDLKAATIQNHRVKHLSLRVADAIANLDAVAAAPIQMALARQTERLRFQQDRYDRMRRILDQRGEEMAKVPGGDSGMLARTYKSIGSGKDVKVYEEYKVDAAFLKEFRELEKQISEELGQYQREAGTHQQTGPLVVIVKPNIGVIYEQRELPVAIVLEHPEGAPRYLSPASDEIAEAEFEDVVEAMPEVDDSEGEQGEQSTWF